MSKRHIIVVGAGISGALSALRLLAADYAVTVVSAGPDPRQHKRRLCHSATLDSGKPVWEMAGRFFTAFEGKAHLGNDPVLRDMAKAFGTEVAEGGWLGKPLDAFSPDERQWLQTRSPLNHTPGHIERVNEEYRQACDRSLALWRGLLRDSPGLFENASVSDDGVLRLFDRPEQLKHVQKSHEEQGVLRASLEPGDVADKHPAYKEAVRDGLIAGGLECEGFAFNIYQFMLNAFDHMEQEGAVFRWETPVNALERDESGAVIGLRTDERELLLADGYSLHPGAYATREFYESIPEIRPVAGLAGRWLHMPAPDEFTLPTKIHQTRRVEDGAHRPSVDVNITPLWRDGKRWLSVGGGYLFAGFAPYDWAAQNLRRSVLQLDRHNQEAMQLYFGSHYRKMEIDGKVSMSTTACVRSMSWDDSPISLKLPTATGGYLTLHTGSNTGTATIAPGIAESVLEAMSNS